MKSHERRRRRIELVAQVSDLKTRVRRVALGALCCAFGILGWVLVAGVPLLPWRRVLVGGMLATVLYLGFVLLRLVKAEVDLERFDNPGRGCEWSELSRQGSA